MKTLYVLLACCIFGLSAVADEPLKKSDFDLVKNVKELQKKVEEHDRLLEALLNKEKQQPKVPTIQQAPSPLASVCGVWSQDFRIGGSGTVIASEQGKSLVMTNRHVVQDGTGQVHVDNGGRRYPGQVIATDTKADLAIILVDATLPVAQLASSLPPKGAKVMQWGRDSRYDNRFVLKEGVALGVRDGRKDFESTIESYLGDSGCGVFDEQGRLVAVNWGGRAHDAETGLPIPGSGGQACVVIADVVRFLRVSAREAFPRFAAGLDGARGAPPVGIGSAPAPKGIQWHEDYATGQAVARESGKPTFILFTDPINCIPCRRLEAGALSDASVKAELQNYVCIRLDINSEAGQRALSDYRNAGAPINGWPTMEVYRNGQRVGDRLTGAVDAVYLLERLRNQPPVSVLPSIICGPTG